MSQPLFDTYGYPIVNCQKTVVNIGNITSTLTPNVTNTVLIDWTPNFKPQPVDPTLELRERIAILEATIAAQATELKAALTTQAAKFVDTPSETVKTIPYNALRRQRMRNGFISCFDENV